MKMSNQVNQTFRNYFETTKELRRQESSNTKDPTPKRFKITNCYVPHIHEENRETEQSNNEQKNFSIRNTSPSAEIEYLHSVIKVDCANDYKDSEFVDIQYAHVEESVKLYETTIESSSAMNNFQDLEEIRSEIPNGEDFKSDCQSNVLFVDSSMEMENSDETKLCEFCGSKSTKFEFASCHCESPSNVDSDVYVNSPESCSPFEESNVSVIHIDSEVESDCEINSHAIKPPEPKEPESDFISINDSKGSRNRKVSESSKLLVSNSVMSNFSQKIVKSQIPVEHHNENRTRTLDSSISESNIFVQNPSSIEIHSKNKDTINMHRQDKSMLIEYRNDKELPKTHSEKVLQSLEKYPVVSLTKLDTTKIIPGGNGTFNVTSLNLKNKPVIDKDSKYNFIRKSAILNKTQISGSKLPFNSIDETSKKTNIIKSSKNLRSKSESPERKRQRVSSVSVPSKIGSNSKISNKSDRPPSKQAGPTGHKHFELDSCILNSFLKHKHCPFCKSKMQNKNHLVQHCTFSCPERETYKLVCRICSKLYAGPKSLKPHMIKVHKVKGDLQSVMNAETIKTPKISSRSLQFLKGSKKVITKIKFVCSLCSNSYVDQYGLRKHLRKNHKMGVSNAKTMSSKSLKKSLEEHDISSLTSNNVSPQKKYESKNLDSRTNLEGNLPPESSAYSETNESAVYSEINESAVYSETNESTVHSETNVYSETNASNNDINCPRSDLSETNYVNDRSKSFVSELFSKETLQQQNKLSVPTLENLRANKLLEFFEQSGFESSSLLCPICCMQMKNIAYLKPHMRQHTNEKPFRCENCELSFFTKNDLNSHIQSKCPRRDEITDIKFQQSSRASFIISSNETREENNSFNCNNCSANFSSLALVINHLNDHNECSLEILSYTEKND